MNLETRASELQDHFDLLDSLVADTAANCKCLERNAEQHSFHLSTTARDMISKRKELRNLESSDISKKVQRAQISKQLQKQIRKELRGHKNKLIAEKVESFKDLKSVSGIRSGSKRRHLTSVLDESGNIQESRQDIVNVFASFYEGLCKSRIARTAWDDV